MVVFLTRTGLFGGALFFCFFLLCNKIMFYVFVRIKEVLQ